MGLGRGGSGFGRRLAPVQTLTPGALGSAVDGNGRRADEHTSSREWRTYTWCTEPLSRTQQSARCRAGAGGSLVAPARIHAAVKQHLGLRIRHAPVERCSDGARLPGPLHAAREGRRSAAVRGVNTQQRNRLTKAAPNLPPGDTRAAGSQMGAARRLPVALLYLTVQWPPMGRAQKTYRAGEYMMPSCWSSGPGLDDKCPVILTARVKRIPGLGYNTAMIPLGLDTAGRGWQSVPVEHAAYIAVSRVGFDNPKVRPHCNNHVAAQHEHGSILFALDKDMRVVSFAFPSR